VQFVSLHPVRCSIVPNDPFPRSSRSHELTFLAPVRATLNKGETIVSENNQEANPIAEFPYTSLAQSLIARKRPSHPARGEHAAGPRPHSPAPAQEGNAHSGRDNADHDRVAGGCLVEGDAIGIGEDEVVCATSWSRSTRTADHSRTTLPLSAPERKVCREILFARAFLIIKRVRETAPRAVRAPSARVATRQPPVRDVRAGKATEPSRAVVVEGDVCTRRITARYWSPGNE
jgi:hypothetical protein